MAQPAQQHPYPIARQSDVEPDSFGAVAAGGPIAELQRTLEQRLLAPDQAVSAEADSSDVAHRFSRFAGPALLVAAYAGVGLWWF